MTGSGRAAPVGVVGAGTMGGGIAQVAAVAGHPVTVYDAVEGAAERAVAAIRDRVARLVAKGRLGPAGLRLAVATELSDLASAQYVIEAVAEDWGKQASPATIDAVLTQAGGFRMGPFGTVELHGTVELPSGALLVRCDGRPATALAAEWDAPVVVVDRTLDDATAAGIVIAACDGCPSAALDEATGLLQAAGLAVYVIDGAPGLVVTRTVAMLVNGAVDARHKGVASAADIDTAMRLGTNYPLGPLAWGQSWGPATVLQILEAMHAWYGEDRYRPSALLRRIAAAGGDLREKS